MSPTYFTKKASYLYSLSSPQELIEKNMPDKESVNISLLNVISGEDLLNVNLNHHCLLLIVEEEGNLNKRAK